MDQLRHLLPQQLLFLLLFMGFAAQSQKPVLNSGKEMLPGKEMESHLFKNTRVETVTGIPRAIYNPGFKLSPSSPDAMAMEYLVADKERTRIGDPHAELKYITTIKSKSGIRVLFEQQMQGYPVYNADIKVSINNDNEVVFFSSNYQQPVEVNVRSLINEQAALQKAKNHLGSSVRTELEEIRKVIYTLDSKSGELAYQVNIITLEEPFGDWELLVSASTGELLRAEDRSCYYHPRSDTVTGSGWVFDPDPITNATTAYGEPGFSDVNDNDTEQLTAQLLEVVLHDITLDDTLYYLKGPYAEVVDAEGPYRGLFKQADSAFHFTRSEDAFEAVNCYHHIHQSMAYLNDTLGFSITPYQYNGGVRFDPHGLNGADNSYYQPGNGRLSFGEGGVDDAEDVGVVVHELGHGIHDWVTFGGISQVNGLSEGLSDYWVTSYIRSLGLWEPEDPEYNWVFIWDGHNPFWPGRVTNDPGHYPEALVGQVHKDGQLWSSSLMQIWDLIGREATDTDCWEGISMTGGNASQVDAALAFMQADMDLYDGEHLDDIAPVFVARGYIESLVTVDFSADQTGGEGPLTVQFQDESTALVGEINAWAWDFNGDGETDATGQNPEYTFTEPGAYSVTLTVTHGESEYSETRENYIIVNSGFFVYEPVKGARDHSGVFIENFLEERGYETIYSNYFPSGLKGFDAVFISLGNYGSQITRVSDAMADIISAYLDEGGKVYLESGDAFGYDQFGNEEFFARFGLETAMDGEEKPVQNLRGQTGTLFEGLYFNNTKQTAVDFIDHYTPAPSDDSQIIFAETGYGNVGIANTGNVIGHQTICFSYALSELEDFSGHSSRYHALVLVMEYFGYSEGDAYVVANFSVNKKSVEEGEEVVFTDWSATPLDYEVNSWKWDLDGDGNIDSEEQNPTWSYAQGGAYTITLIASNGIDTDTLTREDLVYVRSGILVFEEWAEENGFSGTFIRDYLLGNGMEEVTYLNTLPETLSGYDVVFASFGNSGHKKADLSADMASTLLDYGYAGGQLYLEGGDIFSENENLWTLFGLENVLSGEENILNGLEGQQEALTAGLYYESSAQLGQMSIDRYVPFGGEEMIKVAFTESDYGNVAVQFDGSNMFGHKTFCFAYSLADLQDGDGKNTREELLKRILEFFGIFITGSDNDITEIDQSFSVYPNPGNQQLNILFEASEDGKAELGVFDLSGRQVHAFTRQAGSGRNHFQMEMSDLQPGIYIVRMALGTDVRTRKWVVVN